MTAAVSVIIPNLHSPVVGEVLQALLAQTDDVAQSLEVWVVGQDRFGLVHPGGCVRRFDTPQPVFPSRARNLGADAAQGETLIFLDADCVPQPGWLAAMLEAHGRWPEAGAISGAMLPAGDTFASRCGQVSGFHEHLSLHRPGRRRLLASFSLLVPRMAWDAVGGFAPELRIAEDVDFSIRLSRQGRLLYLEPRARIYHRPPRTGWRALWRHALFSGRLSIQVRLRHADWFGMPRWSGSPWAWRLLSPGIATVCTAQVYAGTPGLWRYWRCAPWVLASKLAWCWGAASGLGAMPGWL